MKTFEELIAAKRDGLEHTRGELERLVAGFVSGEMHDYQMSAWLMASLLQGMSDEETTDLTRAMAESGRMVDLSAIPGLKADKHSTGGVGDKTTIVLVPLVASVGVPIAKMSGRGLGHTGGTIDKLEAIPGFRTELSLEEFVSQVASVGCAVIAGRVDIDPADKKMYALRDVTATVPSVPLIVGSIISKKMAGGSDVIVLDVKVGSGAFMKTEAEARELVRSLTATGRSLGRTVECVLTDMEQPLGCAVGNGLEVREAIDVLGGGGPGDVRELCLGLGAKMVTHAGKAPDEESARALLEDSIESGAALARFAAWVGAQGGDARVAEDPEAVLPSAPHTRTVRANTDGYITGFDAEGVGRAAMAMGAGRASTEDEIRLANGLTLAAKVGDSVASGDALATLHADGEAALDEGESRLQSSIEIGQTPPDPPVLFREV